MAAQQKIVDNFTALYGADYVKQYVAAPGYSEHHTGLAIDVYLVVDGQTVYENNGMMEQTELWCKVHEKLPEYGLILRYPPGKEDITGYANKPWHLRYVGCHAAKEITAQEITLEAYLKSV